MEWIKSEIICLLYFHRSWSLGKCAGCISAISWPISIPFWVPMFQGKCNLPMSSPNFFVAQPLCLEGQLLWKQKWSHETPISALPEFFLNFWARFQFLAGELFAGEAVWSEAKTWGSCLCTSTKSLSESRRRADLGNAGRFRMRPFLGFPPAEKAPKHASFWTAALVPARESLAQDPVENSAAADEIPLLPSFSQVS